MARTKISNFAEPAEALAHATVRDYQRRGYKGDAARYQAALALGISPRQCKSLFYREPVRFIREHYEAMQRRFIAHLDRQADELEREAAELRSAAQQYAMEFGCSQSSEAFGRNGDTDAQSVALAAVDETEREYREARALIARQQMRKSMR